MSAFIKEFRTTNELLFKKKEQFTKRAQVRSAWVVKGKREQEEMSAFIKEFRTTNELLFKERNNSLSELRFEVHGLSKVIDNALISNSKVKGVTTREGKTTTQGIHNDNIHTKEPSVFHHDKPVHTPSIPFPRRSRKEKEEAQQRKFLENLKQLHINLSFIEALAQMLKYAKFLKSLLTNKARLEEACTVMMNEMCSAVLLNKVPSKEKDSGSLREPKPTRMSLELADRVVDDEVIFDIDQSIKRPPAEDDECYGIDELDNTINIETQELLGSDQSDSFLLKGLEKSIYQSDLESYNSIRNESNDNSDVGIPIRRIDPVNTPYSEAQKTARTDGVNSEHLYAASANEIAEKKPELKDLLNHLEYAYLHGIKSFSIIISSKFSEKEKCYFCSSWVSPIHVVPKKGGMTVVLNDNNELIPSRTVTGWRVCIDYRKLNDATRKDHFHLLFIDQMLERLSGNEYYCFLDGFLGFFQIPIAPEDQEKTTFTCPYGTLAYKRMPFGLCNAPATFQRCMTTIFHDMVEDFMEVFMDDFSVFAKLNDDEPWLCPDNVMRRCIAGSKIHEILAHCHSGPTGEHHSASITKRKVYKSGFFWPSIFKDAKDYVMRCDACQISGNISSRSEIPQNNIQVCDVFEIRG
ncbi:reverse transcriptase domain-containing protein [Tanacetum coccineum]